MANRINFLYLSFIICAVLSFLYRFSSTSCQVYSPPHPTASQQHSHRIRTLFWVICLCNFLYSNISVIYRTPSSSTFSKTSIHSLPSMQPRLTNSSSPATLTSIWPFHLSVSVSSICFQPRSPCQLSYPWQKPHSRFGQNLCWHLTCSGCFRTLSCFH